MPTIGQLLAVRDGHRRDFEKIINYLDQKGLCKHHEWASGFHTTHQPFAEDAEGIQHDKQPDQGKTVQTTVEQELGLVRPAFERYLDTELTIDAANQGARGDVVVNGVALAEDIPVVTLLWWEGRIAELIGVFGKLPVLEPDQHWTFDSARDMHVSDPVLTKTTRRTNVIKVAIAPTEHQPGQFAQWQDDVPNGMKTTVQLSGKMTAEDHRALIARLRVLQDAVKLGREEGNRVDASRRRAGRALAAFVFDGELPTGKSAKVS
jgi:hypothetical protein